MKSQTSNFVSLCVHGVDTEHGRMQGGYFLRRIEHLPAARHGMGHERRRLSGRRRHGNE
jgi:hypothetical protein